MSLSKVRSRRISRTAFLFRFVFHCGYIPADNVVERYRAWATGQYFPLFCHTGRVSDLFQPSEERWPGTRVLQATDTSEVFLPSPAEACIDERFEINKIRSYVSGSSGNVFDFLQDNRLVSVMPKFLSRLFIGCCGCAPCARRMRASSDSWARGDLVSRLGDGREEVPML